MFYVQSLDKSKKEPLNPLMLSGFAISQNVDGGLTVSFTSLKGSVNTNPGHELLENKGIVHVHGYDYRIEQYSDTAYSKSITAISVLYDHNKTLIEGTFGGNHTLLNHLDFSLKGTGWTCDIDVTIADKINYIEDLGNDNVISVLEKIKKYHGVEYLILPDKHLYVAKEVGPENDFIYRYKHNVSDVVIKKDTTNLSTVIKGYGANGLVAEYVSPNVNVFGRLEADPVRDERFIDSESLLAHLATQIQDEPSIVIESKVPYLTERSIGERVWLNYEPLGINIKVRIVDQTKILVGNKLVTASVVFGNTIYKTSIDTAVEQQIRIRETTKELYLAKEEYRKRFEEEREETNQLIQVAANGKNAIYRSIAEPVGELNDGDLWYNPLGNGETQLYQYGNKVWELVLDTTDLSAIEQAVDEAKKDAQSAIDSVEIAEQNAKNALTIAKNALGNAQESFDKAQEALTKNESTVVRLDNMEGTVTALQLSANGLATRVSNTEGSLSTLTQTVNGLQTTVTQKVDATTYNAYVTQTAQALNSKLSSTDAASTYATQSSLIQTSNSLISRIDDMQIGGRNLIRNTDETTVFRNSATTRKEFLQTSYDLTPIFDKYGIREYSISFDLKLDIAGKVQVYLQNGSGSEYSFSKVFQATTEWVRYSFVITPTHVAPFLTQSLLAFYSAYDSGRIPSVRAVKLELGNKSTDWSPSPDDISSQITQLQDNINLKVSKNDIVNQINVSTESVLISGNKVRITGQTTIDDAAITSAKIASLDAAKVTTGTLNASNVNIVNMNASNITSGTLNAERIASNSITANKLNVTTLSAITSNIGTVNAGTINGVNITSAYINISQDVTIGNNLNLGDPFGTATKEIRFNSRAVIVGGSGAFSAGMSIGARELTLNVSDELYLPKNLTYHQGYVSSMTDQLEITRNTLNPKKLAVKIAGTYIGNIQLID